MHLGEQAWQYMYSITIMAASGAGFLFPKAIPPSAEDLEDMENLDALMKVWYNRKERLFMREGPMRAEAIAHGIGEPAALGRVNLGPVAVSWCSQAL